MELFTGAARADINNSRRGRRKCTNHYKSGAINSNSWRCQTQQKKDASFTARAKLLTLARSTIYSSNLQKEHQFFTAAKGSSFTAGETYTI
ncbi:MAG: hypothetical protein ACK51L_03430 [bacterium]